MTIEGPWQQVGVLLASAWAIWGVVQVSWHAGTRFWRR